MPARPPHPWRYAALYFPMGLMIGYPSVALGYLSAQAGLPVSAAASVVGMAFFAHAFKFLWAPLADYSLSRKTWYRLAIAVMGAVLVGITATPMREATVPLLAGAGVVRQSGRDLRRVRDRRADGPQRGSARPRAGQRVVPERQPVRADRGRRARFVAHAADADAGDGRCGPGACARGLLAGARRARGTAPCTASRAASAPGCATRGAS